MKVLVALGLLLGGAVVGVAAVAVHQVWWALVLGVAATCAAVWALPGGWWRRLPFGVGWSATVALLAVPRPEGDYVIAATLPGYTMLVLAVLVLLVSVATAGRARTVG